MVFGCETRPTRVYLKVTEKAAKGGHTGEMSFMDDTTHTDAKPRVPRVQIWIVAAVLLAVGLGMYAGTMYRIENYGYVGSKDDRPIDGKHQIDPEKPHPN